MAGITKTGAAWMLLLVVGVGCTPKVSPPAQQGSLVAAVHGGFVDVSLDSNVVLESLAATVTITGTLWSGNAQPGALAEGKDLFVQKSNNTDTLRFVVADSHGLRLAKSGVLVRIPVLASPSGITVKEISAGDVQGQSVVLQEFSNGAGQP